MKYKLIKVFILLSFLLMPYKLLPQPLLETKDSIFKAEYKVALPKLEDSLITKEHKAEIEKAAKSTPFGEVFWTYFGEIIIAGFSLLIVYTRVVIKNFFALMYEKLAKRESKKSSYTNKDIEKLGNLSENINEYLTKIKEITKSKRVLLYQFSNGSHFFSNIPVLRMTVTNYSEGDNVKVTDNVFNYVTAKDIVHQILNDEYLEITEGNTTNKYSGYTSYLRFAKFKSSTLVRVNVSDNYCGVIELIEPTHFELAAVRSYCYSIGHLFERYNREKEESEK